MNTFKHLFQIAKKLNREFIVPKDFYVALNDNAETELQLVHKKFRLITPNTK